MATLIRIPPYFYIHVLDNNTNVQRVESGPQTFTRQDHEKVVIQPTPMIVVPPRHYAIVLDPCIRADEKTKEPALDKHGQVRVRHGDREIRFAEQWADPFPLVPGETLEGDVAPVQVIPMDTALRLTAKRDFTDHEGNKKVAGDEWLFHGPATYYMRVEVEIVDRVQSSMVLKDHGLRIQAREQCVDSQGIPREAGEEWVYRKEGAYMPQVNEKVIGSVKPTYLIQTRALHLRAANTFKDVYGVVRKAGEEWLVTHSMSEIHLQDVHEEVVNERCTLTCLGKLQYCVVLDPVDAKGTNQYGQREMRKGETSFFLQPGESLDGGIQNINILGAEEALLLRCKESFKDGAEQRNPGDQWMIIGPCDYIPPVEVECVQKRKRIPLDENEGVYVRDNQSGQVRLVSGCTYMLEANEELFAKELSSEVEQLLAAARESTSKVQARNKTRVVDYRVPHNAAVQIYDYKEKKSRCVFGPAMVMLDPDEQFTVLSLSGDKPKRPNVIKSLALSLGPDFMTDIIEVETADHARLRLQLSYNWQFNVHHLPDAEREKIFQVRDFVGDTCKAIGGRVRGAVATAAFEDFHKNSANIIRVAVFGRDDRGKINDEFHFNSNHLSITNIDIQSVEPVDERTRESLQKSVQLAIEITTKKQERNARHQAMQIEQDARNKIERQKITNMTESEKSKQLLIQLQAESAAVASTGTAKAEAEAKAEYYEIEGRSDVEQAQLSADASGIEGVITLEEGRAMQQMQLDHEAAVTALDIAKSQRLASIETDKFKMLVDSISPETIKAIARAGPEMQGKLLKGLGLKGYLMTDGNSPINLFNAAKGMVSGGGMPGGVSF